MDKDGNTTEEVEVIEGAPGVVKAKVEAHKKVKSYMTNLIK